MKVHPKVQAAAVSGFIIAILTFFLSQFTTVAVTPELASAITTLVAFIAAFFTPSPSA